MIDREKVIKALEDFNKNRICLPHLIPWDEITDVLALLSEQGAVEPNRGLSKTQTAWFCGACGFRLNRAGRYCSKCGKEVKWE